MNTIVLLTIAVLYGDGSIGSFSTPFATMEECQSGLNLMVDPSNLNPGDQVIGNCLEYQDRSNPPSENALPPGDDTPLEVWDSEVTGQ